MPMALIVEKFTFHIVKIKPGAIALHQLAFS